MSAYIESFELIDAALLSSVTTRIQPLLLLEDIEAGSIRAWLKNTLESIDDEALKSGDYKKLIGSYLVQGKKAMIDFIEKRTTIQSTTEIADLQNELLAIAEETDALRIPTYHAVPSIDIAQSLKALGDASTLFLPGDTAQYLSRDGATPINVSFSISPTQIEDLLVKEQLSNEAAMILRVKKPDFLGESMWDFVHSGKTLPMRMADTEWLKHFRHGEVVLLPGDSLRASVRTTVRYGFDNEVVGTQYEVVKVLDVLHYEPPPQIPLE